MKLQQHKIRSTVAQTKIAQPVYQHITSHISEDLYQFDCNVHIQKDNLDNNEEVNNFCSLVVLVVVCR